MASFMIAKAGSSGHSHCMKAGEENCSCMRTASCSQH